MSLTPRILIVDDTPAIHADFRKILAPAEMSATDAMDADLFGDELKKPGEVSYRIDCAGQGLEGIELARLARQAEDPYAVAFVDVRMPPGLDGIETIARLWEVDPQLEVVICSAYSDYTWHRMIEKLARPEQFLVLSKPFDSTSVRQVALALSGKWRLSRNAEAHVRELEDRVNARTLQLSTAHQKLEDEMQEREQMQERVRHSSKLEALGRLVSGIAHEINNPLAFVVSNLQFVKDELNGAPPAVPQLTSEVLGALDDAHAGARRIQEIVADLKTFSRMDAQALTPVDIVDVVGFSLRMCNTTLRKAARLATDLQASPLVNAHQGMLGQVVVNLLVNASQAFPERGESNEIRARTGAAPDGRALIEIRDTGKGIAAENLNRIFDPFFTTKKVGDGTGLGLAVCQGIITRFGGEIRVESEFGKGTTITILLPASQKTQPHPGRTSEAELTVPGQEGLQRLSTTLRTNARGWRT